MCLDTQRQIYAADEHDENELRRIMRVKLKMIFIGKDQNEQNRNSSRQENKDLMVVWLVARDQVDSDENGDDDGDGDEDANIIA